MPENSTPPLPFAPSTPPATSTAVPTGTPLRRVACVRIPAPHLAFYLRARRGAALPPTALLDEAGLVRAASREARQAGVEPGMTRKQAEAMAPHVRFDALDPHAEAAEWERLALLLGRFSPTVEKAEEAGVFYLDAHGLGRLYPSLREYLAHIRFTLQGEGYQPRVAVAGSRFAARAATHLNEIHVVPPGRDPVALAPLPLALLPLSPGLRETFAALGLRALGDLTAIPVAELEARFGREGIEAVRLAQGEDPTPLRPFATPELAAVELALDGPLEQGDAVRFLLANLANRLIDILNRRGLACEEARLVLRLDDRSEQTLAIEPAAPTLSARLLADLAFLALERNPLPAPILHARLEAARAGAAAPDQRVLFVERGDPDRAELAVARLRNLLGDEAVLRPRRVAAWRPEQRVRWEEYQERRLPPRDPSSFRRPREGRTAGTFTSRSAVESDADGAGRFLRDEGLRLCAPPLPVQVRVDAGGRPVWCQSAWAWGPLARVEGPERIGGDWWSTPYERDYYRIDWPGGAGAWIFLDRLANAWYLHGIYD